jgi:hypothetical protein
MTFVKQLGPAVLHLEAPQNAPPAGAYLAVQYDAPVAAHHVDFYWQPRSVAVQPPETKLCFQKEAIPAVEAPISFPQDELSQAEQERQKRPFHQLSFIWMMLMVLAKNVWRQPKGVNIQYLEYALGTLHALQEQYHIQKTFLNLPTFRAPLEKCRYLLDLAGEVKQLMGVLHQKGENVPFESVDGVWRFIKLVENSYP